MSINGAVAHQALEMLKRLRESEKGMEVELYRNEHGALEDLLSEASLSVVEVDTLNRPVSVATRLQEELLKLVVTLIDAQVEGNRQALRHYNSSNLVEKFFYMGEYPTNDVVELKSVSESIVLGRCYAETGERAKGVTKALQELCSAGMLECETSAENNSRSYTVTAKGRVTFERYSAEQSNVADG